MGQTVERMFSISADWETMEEGSPEERASFGAIGVRLGNLWLSEGHDPFVRRVRNAPLLSAFHLSEWLTWNWWRLRWEPRSRATDWGLSHRMATIGSGYVWPNITIFSDGERVAIVAKPSRNQETSGYRYIADTAGVLPAQDFENAVDRFLSQVDGQLDAEGLRDNNLARLSADLAKERRDARLGRVRKIEALLGVDPDEAPAGAVEQLIQDEDRIGPSAAAELAAESGNTGRIILAQELFELAASQGFEVSARESFVLRDWQPPVRANTPAWLVGQQAAQAVRAQLRCIDKPLDDNRLSELLAVDTRVLLDSRPAPISFSLDQGNGRRGIVLRSRWKTGRRFELARILGAKLSESAGGRLLPVTRSFTYQQKIQRAFAAELLSPFEAVEGMLQGDYSDEQQQEVAEHFKVSPLTIRTLLVNHRKIERDDLGDEVDGNVIRAASA